MPQTGVRFTVDVDGQDAETFAVVSFHLVQSYSSLFTLDIHIASSNIRLNARDLLEQTAVLTIWQGSTPQRHIKGLTARLERGEYDGHIMHYHLRVHPPSGAAVCGKIFAIFSSRISKASFSACWMITG